LRGWCLRWSPIIAQDCDCGADRDWNRSAPKREPVVQEGGEGAPGGEPRYATKGSPKAHASGGGVRHRCAPSQINGIEHGLRGVSRHYCRGRNMGKVNALYRVLDCHAGDARESCQQSRPRIAVGKRTKRHAQDEESEKKNNFGDQEETKSVQPPLS
jgi:hypothetical protein